MSFKILLPLLLIVYLQSAFAQLSVSLDTASSYSFYRPVAIANAGDHLMYVVEQDGGVRTLDSNNLSNLLLGIGDRVLLGTGSGDERGLLGLAFHPNFKNNGYFYVNYVGKSGADTYISRFTLAPGATQADKTTESILMVIQQPFSSHNGGDLKFGADGYLYIALGDGGSGGDPQNNAQNANNLLGTILRIDIDTAVGYKIPPDNPFVGDSTKRDEIWSYGLRNPWKISFDRETNDLYIADVGQNQWEEVSFQDAGSQGGENYGWRCYEGNHAYNTVACPPDSNLVFPIFAYPHNINTGGFSITGGFVYRGVKHPRMRAYYFFTDYVSGNFWGIKYQSGNIISTYNIQLPGNYTSFGEGADGELYIADINGIIYNVIDSCENPFPVFSVLNPNCQQSDGLIDLEFAGNTNGPYSYIWSTGATIEDLSGLSSGIYYVSITDANACQYLDSVSLSDAAPSYPITSNIQPNKATLSWAMMEESFAYNIRGRLIGNTNWVNILIPSGDITSKVIHGLGNGSLYEWQIQSVLDQSGSRLSCWSPLIQFQTACQKTDSLNTSEITQNSARFNWTSVNGASGYEIRGRIPGSSGWKTILINGGNTISRDVFGLVANTAYIWQIKTWCDLSGIRKSTFSETDTFTTAISSSKMSFHNDIDNQSWFYPNPLNDAILNLEIPACIGNVELELVDLSGRQMFQKAWDYYTATIIKEKINLKHLEAGVYILRLKNGDRNYHRKLMIAH